MQAGSCFREAVCNKMVKLRRNKELCDVVIRVDEQTFHCHKLVLAASSPLLHNVIRESGESWSIFNDYSLEMDFLLPAEAEVLLDFLYTGCAEFEEGSTVGTVLKILTDEKNACLPLGAVSEKLNSSSAKSNNEFNSVSEKKQDLVHCVTSETIADPFEFSNFKFCSQNNGNISSIFHEDASVAKSEQDIVLELHEPIRENRSNVLSDIDLSLSKRNRGDEFLNFEEDGSLHIDNIVKKRVKSCQITPQARSRVKLPRQPPFLCPCQNCGKIFESHQRLRSHFRHTHGEKKYKCDQCPMRFLYPKDLKNHMRTHTGERPFICEICGKSFAQIGSLTVHCRTHDKPKHEVFRPCPHCAKKYCLKDKGINTEYLNACESMIANCICPNSNCAKKFSSVKCLRKHLRGDVCNPNKFYCGICNSKFLNSIQVRNHVGTVHCTHKKRKRVKPCVKIKNEQSKMESSSSREIDAQDSFSSCLATDLPIFLPVVSNVEEVDDLIQLSEEVVIKDDD